MIFFSLKAFFFIHLCALNWINIIFLIQIEIQKVNCEIEAMLSKYITITDSKVSFFEFFNFEVIFKLKLIYSFKRIYSRKKN